METGINTWSPSLSNLHHVINDIVNSSNVLSFVLFADATTVYLQNDSIDSVIEILNTIYRIGQSSTVVLLQ